MLLSKIEYRISYINSLNGFGYLHYPYELYDLAVIHDGKKVIVKPIIEALPGKGFFTFKGKPYFLRDFAHNHGNNIPPEWALDWVKDRVDKKPYKVDLRMSDMDRFILNGAIKRRQNVAIKTLKIFGHIESGDIS